MTLRKQAYLAPFNFTGSQVQIRLCHPSGETTLTKNLDPNQTFWIAGDAQSGSNRSDLLSFISGAINTNTVGLTASVYLDPDTQQVQMSGNLAFGLRWEHSASTVRLNEVLGFPATKYPTVNATTFTAPSQSSHSWLPEWPTSFDTYDEPIIIGHKTFSLSMAQSGYSFETDVKERRIQFEYLPSGSILEASRTAGISSSLESFHQISLVKDFRVYDDRSDRSLYGVYCFQDLTKPWLRSGDTRQIRYNAALNLYGLRKETGDFVQVDSPAEILSFTATPSTSSVTASVLLEWTTSNATSVDIDQAVGTGLAANDSISITGSASGSLTYTLTAYGAGGNDTAQVSVLWQSGSATDIITKYTWYWSFWGSKVTPSDWYPQGTGSGDVIDTDPLTPGGFPAATGQSTTGINSSALPAGLVNAGVNPNSTTGSSTQGYGDSSAAGLGHIHPSSSFHVRFIVKPSSLSSTRLFSQYFGNASNFYNFRTSATSEEFRIQITKAGTSTTLDCGVGSINNGYWHVIDWVHDDASGSSVRINGVEKLFTGSIGASPFATWDSASTLFGLMGSRSAATTMEGTYLFYGVRALTAGTDFPIASSSADATQCGLTGS